MFKTLSTVIAGPVILTGQAVVCVGSAAVSAGSTIQLFGLIKESNWEMRAAIARGTSSGKQAARQIEREEKMQACVDAKAIKAERKAQKATSEPMIAKMEKTVHEMNQALSEANSAEACPA